MWPETYPFSASGSIVSNVWPHFYVLFHNTKYTSKFPIDDFLQVYKFHQSVRIVEERKVANLADHCDHAIIFCYIFQNKS